MNNVLHSLQYALVVVLIVAGFFFLTVLLTAGRNMASGNYSMSTSSRYRSSNTSTLSTQNPVAASMVEVGSKTLNGIQATGNSIANAGKAIATTVGHGAIFVARGVGSIALNIIRIPGKIIGAVTAPPSASALIRPEDESQASIPVIDPLPYVAQTAIATAAPPSVEPLTAAVDHAHYTDSLWPIHGRITTYFGVPHWPYQPTHTGMDISSGLGPGNIAIHPFRNGKVSETIYSSRGLGNHVVVDHGNGITSVYAHLYSIAVQPGQEVNTSTVLGLEGSTGASTGAHLHFEIRENGTPVDPQTYFQNLP